MFWAMTMLAGGTRTASLQGKAETSILAPPDRVYQLVSDVKRMGEWSPECYRCEWLDAATMPAVGARFKGYNRRGWARWAVPCRVVEAEAGRTFAFETLAGGRVQTRWRYDLEGHEDGCILRESFEVLWHTRLIMGLLGGPKRRLAHMEEGVAQTLQRIKAAVEAQRVEGMQ